MRDDAILLLSCPDRPGLVAEISNFIHRNRGNIVALDEHVDAGEDAVFFMRVAWDLRDFLIPRDALAAAVADLVRPFDPLEQQLHFTKDRPRLALFVSKASHCLYDLLARHESGELDVDIPLIVSNHETLRRGAERFGVPFHVFPITPATKATQEREELALLRDHGVDTVVLARYMQVLTDELVAALPATINIHHSFLPAFVGARPYRQAFERGVKVVGATSHYVTAQLDEGPIIAQDVMPVTHRDGVADLVRKGRDLEKTVLARAVWHHVRRRVLTHGRRTVVFD